jgi:hypothetical protein
MIQGQLPWQSMQQAGNPFAASGSPQLQQLGQQYQQGYDSALALNAANYQNILSGYQQTAGAQRSAYDALGAGYADLGNQLGRQQYQVAQAYDTNLGDLRAASNRLTQGYDALTNQVLGGIQGIGQSRARDIDAAATARSAQLAQQMINSGLGNSTVQAAFQRGIMLDRERAQNALAEQIAGLRAGYQSQLGQANLNQQQAQIMAQNQQANLGLGYQAQAFLNQNQLGLQGLAARERGYGADTALAQNQLAWMNSVNAPYPNPALYAQLAQQIGANQQYQQNRQDTMDALRKLQGASDPGFALRAMGTPSARGGGGGLPAPSGTVPGMPLTGPGYQGVGSVYNPYSQFQNGQTYGQIGQGAGSLSDAEQGILGGFEAGMNYLDTPYEPLNGAMALAGGGALAGWLDQQPNVGYSDEGWYGPSDWDTYNNFTGQVAEDAASGLLYDVYGGY